MADLGEKEYSVMLFEQQQLYKKMTSELKSCSSTLKNIEKPQIGQFCVICEELSCVIFFFFIIVCIHIVYLKLYRFGVFEKVPCQNCRVESSEDILFRFWIRRLREYL